MKIRQLRGPVVYFGILGLLCFGLAIAIVNQQITNSRLSADISKQKDSLSRTARQSSEYRILSVSYKELSGQLGGRYQTVSWSSQMPSVMNQITGIMESHGLKVDTLRPEPLTSSDGISRLPLRISFKAGIGDLAKLIQEIDSTVPLLEIERLDIHTEDDKPDLLQADMTLSSFAITDSSASAPSNQQMKNPAQAVMGSVTETSPSAKKPVKVGGSSGGKQ